jgi:hypothetical protein
VWQEVATNDALWHVLFEQRYQQAPSHKAELTFMEAFLLARTRVAVRGGYSPISLSLPCVLRGRAGSSCSCPGGQAHGRGAKPSCVVSGEG